MKTIMKKSLIPFLSLATVLLPAAALAGAGGAGNTEDASLQYEFARSTAAQIIRNVSPRAVLETTGRQELQKIYEACRETLFVGTLRTRFELVTEIPDGEGFHAIAQRVDGSTIRISRKEMEKLLANGTLSGPFMTALVLHEVGHDCRIDGQQLDDSRDADLNALAEGLISAAGSEAATHLIDLKFIEQVRGGQPVRFLDLSRRVREQLTRKYLDYVGDWAFVRHQAELPFRPAPASDFFADQRTSVFPGWSLAMPAAASPSLDLLVRNVLEASAGKDLPVFMTQGRRNAIPSTLSCESLPNTGSNAGPETVRCLAQFSWDGLPDAALSQLRQELEFSLDLFGTLKITRVRVIEPATTGAGL